MNLMVGIRSLSLALLTLALLPASAAATPATQIIVKRDPGLTAAERADIRADAGVRFVETLPLPSTEVVAAQPGDVYDAVRELNRDPDVVYAKPDYVRRTAASPPNDPSYNWLWALKNTGQLTPGFDNEWISGTDDADMDVEEAWDHSLGAGQTVAVVDTGVMRTHPDLSANVAPGYDWVDRDSDPSDPRGHGTLVAGSIAAPSNNERGIAGVAPQARVLPLRVLNAAGSGRVSDVVAAFDFAGDAGIRVVNASFGAQGYSQAEHDVMASHPQTLFVAAAGNRGASNEGADAEYPCSYPLANIICVGASDADDERATFSNYGQAAVDLFAPGDRIFSTYNDSAYRVVSGTSMSAPHVAGVAALLLAADPSLDLGELKTAILEHGDPKDAFEDASLTGTRANADEALHSVPADRDGDGVEDSVDNCAVVPNPEQEDLGDACASGETDSDGDGTLDESDACLYEAGAAISEGCPGTAKDGDSDGRLDIFDNCVASPNWDQADDDSDGLGTACDPTPRGHDNDGDGKPALDDSCPTVYGTLANGCPAPSPPPPPPSPPNGDGDNRIDAGDACPTEYAISNDGCPIAQIAAVSPRVKRRSAAVTVSTSRAATVKITVERKKGRRWVRVARKTLAAPANTARLTVKRLKRGAHRVRVSISSSGGVGTPRTKRFRVR